MASNLLADPCLRLKNGAIQISKTCTSVQGSNCVAKRGRCPLSKSPGCRHTNCSDAQSMLDLEIKGRSRCIVWQRGLAISFRRFC